MNKLQWLKRPFTNNWSLKLMAILLVVVCFYAIRGATSFEVPYDIPIEVEVEQGVAILDQTRTTKVTFRGSQEDLGRLEQQNIKVMLRCEVDNTTGSKNIAISPKNVVGASGVTVVKIKPDNITLTFDREVAKKFSVAKPEVIGEPLIGKVEIDYEPREVIIRGPRRRLVDKDVVDTEPVDVDGRVESFTKQVRILAPGGDTGISVIEPPEVSVTVSIVTETTSMQLTNVTVAVLASGGDAAGIIVRPATVDVSVQGRADVVESISADSIKVFVDCTEHDGSSTGMVPVLVHLPPGINANATVRPEKVRITCPKPGEPAAKETETVVEDDAEVIESTVE